jgi:hypothetical protein
MSSRIQEMFEQAGCAGQLSVLSLGGRQEVAVDADRSVGVIEYPDGRGYSAAIFCQSHQPWQTDAAINAAIGSAAAAAIDMLQS